MIFTESMLEEYSKPLSVEEDRQCKNAIGSVGNALKSLGFFDAGNGISLLYSDTYSYSLQMKHNNGRQIKLFVQGSYANNTNVRRNSDVDIAVVQEETFNVEYRKDPIRPQTNADYKFVKADESTTTFKDEVQECLERVFGSSVERKNKSIKVHGNATRKDADTVPCRRYRDYRSDYNKDPSNYVAGIVITPDVGEIIINYPEQHIKNGSEKNVATYYYYKKMVRIMKKMRYIMQDSQNISACSKANNVSSFLLESLLWNVQDVWYLRNCSGTRKVFAFDKLIEHLISVRGEFMSYKEANGIKPLCKDETVKSNLCSFLLQLKDFYQFV